MTALIRNLATMTRVGVLAPGSDGTATVVAQLGDAERIRRARVHPIAVLAALRRTRPAAVPAAAASGTRCARSSTPSTPRSTRRSATSSRRASGCCSRSTCRARWRAAVAGVPGLTPRDASAALALVTAATEPRLRVVGFFAGRAASVSAVPARPPATPDGLTPLAISPAAAAGRRRARRCRDLPFGGTDCALPMLYAQAHEREIDTFVIYTDSETWAGDIHPAQALRDYRRASGIDARLVVVGMVSNGFSIADPNDPGMLDVVGFDTATPQLISDFARGAL